MHPQRSRPTRAARRAIRRYALGWVCLWGAACGSGPDGEATPAVSVTDPTGRTVALDAPAHRIVSLIPAVTDWLVAMGGADRLVARTDFDRHPAVRALPSVGGGLTPSIEWLAARHPDLVVAWPDAPSRSLVSRLEQVGTPVYAAPAESMADAFAVVRDLGTLLAMSAAADSAIAEVRTGLDSLRAAVRTPDRTVLYLVGVDPLMAAGPDTFLDELIRAAGARNALRGLDIRWPQLSLEDVVHRAPDVVIVGTTSLARDPVSYFQDRPGWRHVPAVQDGRVFAVDPDHNRPGPRLHESAALLATLVHDSVNATSESAAPPGTGSR